jgi:hypothetical protein
MSKSSRHWMLGAVGALIALPLAQAAAQTIVQNIDEPGRNPYQETVQGGFHNFAGFQVSFSVVPVNTRRVLKHVNCQVTVQAQHAVTGVTLFDSLAIQREELPTLTSRSFGTSALSIYGENPELYIEAGNFPYIFVFTNDSAAGIICRLSGYDVNLSPPPPPPQTGTGSQTQQVPPQ